MVGDGRSWQEPTLAPAPEEHRPWLLRSSDPGVLRRSTDPGFCGAPTLRALLRSTDPGSSGAKAPEEHPPCS